MRYTCGLFCRQTTRNLCILTRNASDLHAWTGKDTYSHFGTGAGMVSDTSEDVKARNERQAMWDNLKAEQAERDRNYVEERHMGHEQVRTGVSVVHSFSVMCLPQLPRGITSRPPRACASAHACWSVDVACVCMKRLALLSSLSLPLMLP